MKRLWHSLFGHPVTWGPKVAQISRGGQGNSAYFFEPYVCSCGVAADPCFSHEVFYDDATELYWTREVWGHRFRLYGGKE